MKDSKSGRLHTQCKDCYKLHRKIYYAEHYTKYKKAYQERARYRRAQLRHEYRSNMLKYLDKKLCEICGEADIRTLEFDHVDPSKKSFGISQAVRLGYRWKDVVIEIEKCRILCANCHKKTYRITIKLVQKHLIMEARTGFEPVYELLQSSA